LSETITHYENLTKHTLPSRAACGSDNVFPRYDYRFRATGSRPSSTATLTVMHPDPTLTIPVPPAQALTASAGTETTFTLTGTGFTTATTLRLTSPAPATTTTLAVSVLSPTQMTVTIPAEFIQRIGNYSLLVVNPQVNGLGGGTSNALTLTVRAAVATQAEFVNVTTAITAGNALNAFTIRFRDQFGNLVANNVNVSFANEDGSSTGTITLTKTGTVGVSTATATRFYDAGVYKLWVEGISTTTGNVNVVVNPAAAASVEFRDVADTILAGGSQTVRLIYRDAFGNLADAARTLSFSKSGTPSSTGTISLVRSFTGVSLATVTVFSITGNYTLSVNGFATTAMRGTRTFVVRGTPAPSITAFTPLAVTVGSTATLTIAGSGFIPESQVLIAGRLVSSALVTFVSDTELRVEVPSAATAVADSVSLAVRNLPPGGGVSNTLRFAVNNPVPVLLGRVDK
jgi:hypothetical protein